MKIAIYGKGWLGTMIHKAIPDSILLGRGDMVTGFDVLINAAAKTNIDLCEKNKVETVESNVTLAANLAKLCKQSGAKYVFISSACIFESKDINDVKDENSTPNPQCFYARTKWFAEELIQEIDPDVLIVRPRLPISEVPHPRNTINKLLSYDKIITGQETVTVVEDFIPKLVELIEQDAKGTYNVVNKGTISPSEIADAFGHPHEKVSKASQDSRLASEGRAKRVTTIIRSIRTEDLPDIRERLKDIVKKYNG